MSDKSGGFFSSVGRFFSGSSTGKSKEAEKSIASSGSETIVSSLSSSSPTPPAVSASIINDIITTGSSKSASADEAAAPTPKSGVGSRLRYLNPPPLDSHKDLSNGLEIDVDAMPDIFSTTPAVSASRKRQLTELDRQILPQSFRSESVKRSRFLNRSLLEPTLKSSLNNEKKLDMSWCGEFTANHSPASSITNFSLLSRRSGANTNGSLSTRTQEIFKKLEGVNTPAKDVQRMSMLRAGLSRPEKWSSLNESRDGSSTATPPPLKKAADAIPSRIQLISKSMGMSARRNPYWTDLTRKRTISRNGDNNSSDTSSLRSLNGNFASTELSSVFSLDQPTTKKFTSSSSASTAIMNPNNGKQHVSILKGPDGKTVSRNTFKLIDDVEEEDETQKLPPLPEATLSNPQPLKLAPESAPQRGFLDNLSFSFSRPVDVVSAVGTAKTTSVSSSNRTSESKDVDSDSSSGVSIEKQSSEGSNSHSSESDDSGDSDDSELEVSEDNADEVKESRPQTSADTISSADGSNPSNQSSKDSSPKMPKEADPVVPVVSVSAPAASSKWTCNECFTDWNDSQKDCGCCGTARGGVAAPSGQKPAEKQLVSNLSSFAPTNSNFKFGFGGSSTSTTAPSAVSSTTSSTFGSSSTATGSVTPALFGSAKPNTVPTVASTVSTSSTVSTLSTTSTGSSVASPSSSTEGRVAWECPDCFVSNKATDDKCPCCSHVKYASTESSNNVFGNRAFKPLSTAGSAVQFGVSNSSTASQPLFGFGASKPTEALSSAAPSSAFGFSAKPALNVPTSEPTKTASLFSNITKPDSSSTPPAAIATLSVPTAPASSTKPLFGAVTGSLFGSSKPAEPASQTAPQANLFGSALNKEPPTTVPAPQAPVSAAPISSLFESSTAPSTTAFGGSSLFGNSKASTDPLKPAAALSFGGPTSTPSEASKSNLFGSVLPATAPNPVQLAPISSTPSLFGSGSSATSNLFSSKPADSTTSIFGKPIHFGGEVGTTTTDGVAPKRGLFSSDPPTLSFGGEKTSETSSFGGFGGSATTATAPASSGSLFGGSSSTSMFGGPTNSAAPFQSSSSSTSTAPPAFGGPALSFGGTSTSSGFGSFGTKQPAISTSSSTNSLFSQAPADSSNPFGNANSNGFNFGASSTTSSAAGGSVFQFGSSAPAAPAPAAALGPPFQFSNNLNAPAPAPGSLDNAFSYQAPSGIGARKMALARRRNRK